MDTIARAAACIGLALVGASGRLGAQFTERVSLGKTGAQGNGGCGNGVDEIPATSHDGRYVAFVSAANNLVTNDTNGTWDVFVRDRALGTLQRASVGTGGVQGNGASLHVAISADARHVAFVSLASNLVAGDANGGRDVFVRDLVLGQAELASVSSAGVQGSGESQWPALSADGRYLAFASSAADLVAGDTNGFADVFVRDRSLGLTTRVSTATDGTQADEACQWPAISGDGRTVAFWTRATNLAPTDTYGFLDLFTHDRALLTTELVTVADPSSPFMSTGSGGGASFSYDGRFLVFHSQAHNLVQGDHNGVQDVFLRDRWFGITERISLGFTGVEPFHASGRPTVSADGRLVAFQSASSVFITNDNNGVSDVFVRDRSIGVTSRASVSDSGAEGSSGSDSAVISPDGRRVAFTSYAADLVPGDTNGLTDVFVRNLEPWHPGAYCTAGTSTNGCVSRISIAGTPSASASAGFTLSASPLEGLKQGLFFYGVDNGGFVPTPWGAGSSWMCVKAPVQRTPPQLSGGTFGRCDGSLALDWNAYAANNPGALGAPFFAGRHVYAQAWYRDPAAPKTTNLSDAFDFIVYP